MREHPIEDPDGDARDAQDREDRRREQGGEVVPLGGYIDVDGLERSKAAAGPIRSSADRLREVDAPPNPGRPRLVVAGDVVAELERQHRRAYHRRQEAAARRARWRHRAEDLAVVALAVVGAVVLLSLAAELSARH